MILQAIAFYLFAFVAIAAAVMVVTARNPVHSVLFLVLTFFNAAGLFVLTGAEFLAMILVIVYVGAVAVLFLFVVMMLDINFVELREGFQRYLPIGGAIAAILLGEIIFVGGLWAIAPEVKGALAEKIPEGSKLTNTEMLGRLIYTKYVYLFQLAGMVLFVAMVGAIVLTLRQRSGVRKQKIATQVYRRRDESVELKKVQPGEGV